MSARGLQQPSLAKTSFAYSGKMEGTQKTSPRIFFETLLGSLISLLPVFG